MIGVRSLVGAVVALAVAVPSLRAADAVPKKDDVSYYKEIRPLIQQHCQGCHQPAKPLGGYVMTNHAALFKKGEKEQPGVVAGKPDESYLLEQIVPREGKPALMPKGKPALLERDVQQFKKWIAQGAKDDTPISARETIDQENPPKYTSPPVISALDYSPDGQLIAVSGYHEVILHKADGSGMVARFVGLSERIEAVAFSPDGKLLAVAGGSPGRFGEIQIWDLEKKKLKLSVPASFDTLFGLSWSPDGGKLAFGCVDNTLRAIAADTGEQVLYQGAHSDWVLNTTFSADGKHLVSVSRDRSMKLTEVATQRFIDNVTSITPGALKGGLASVSLRPLSTKRFVKSPPDPQELLYAELVIGGSDGVPRIYKMHREVKRVIGDDANRLREFEAMPGRIYALRCSADGSRFAAGSSLDGKGEVRVYRLAGRTPDLQAQALNALPLALPGVSPLIFMGDYQTNPKVSTFDGQHGAVYAVAYRPDGAQVASGGFDGTIRLNDPNTGKLVKEFVAVPLEPARK